MPAGMPRVAQVDNVRAPDLKAPFGRVFESSASNTNRESGRIVRKFIRMRRGANGNPHSNRDEATRI